MEFPLFVGSHFFLGDLIFGYEFSIKGIQRKRGWNMMESSMFKGKSRMEINGFEDLQGLPQIPEIFVQSTIRRTMMSRAPSWVSGPCQPCQPSGDVCPNCPWDLWEDPMSPTVNAQRLTNSALDGPNARRQLGCASQSVKC